MEVTMSARTPEEICRHFQKYMLEGDIDSVLSLYEPRAVFLDEAGELKSGIQELREQLAPFAAAKTLFNFAIKEIITSGDIALMQTGWTVSSLGPTMLYAIEVARRQRDGTWRWVIGDPYTVNKHRPSVIDKAMTSQI
jgi:ketosteroid isomerase-like protein